MAKQRHLDKAPITEAIVDFRVKAKPDLDVGVFKSLQSELSEQYPEMREISVIEAQFQYGSQGVKQSVKRPESIGYRFTTSNGLNIAQYRLDGFTFNRLKPYTSWEEISSTVREHWSRYVRVAIPNAVTRLALRYINRIELPSEFDGYDEFMTAPPPIPGELQARVTKFLTRVIIRDEKHKLDAHITQALEAHQVGDKRNLLLDIDTFRDFSEKSLEIDSEEIHETFDLLHLFKNRIFFESLTEQTISRIEKLR